MYHVRRIRLIKALQYVCGLSISAIRDVLTTVDEADGDLHRVLGAGQCLPAPAEPAGDPPAGRPRAEAARLVRERGWQVKRDTPAMAALTDVIGTLYALDQCDILERLPDYADLAESIARVDLALVCARTDLDSMVEGVVVGNTLGDALMSALRRLAQESLSAERFGDAGVPLTAEPPGRIA
jgi:hypothetical protein